MVYLLKMGGSFHGKLLVITRWYNGIPPTRLLSIIINHIITILYNNHGFDPDHYDDLEGSSPSDFINIAGRSAARRCFWGPVYRTEEDINPICSLGAPRISMGISVSLFLLVKLLIFLGRYTIISMGISGSEKNGGTYHI